jgi:hypothetical protein
LKDIMRLYHTFLRGIHSMKVISIVHCEVFGQQYWAFSTKLNSGQMHRRSFSEPMEM